MLLHVGEHRAAFGHAELMRMESGDQPGFALNGATSLNPARWLDSAQHTGLPQVTRNWADLGSGGGFPGLVVDRRR